MTDREITVALAGAGQMAEAHCRVLTQLPEVRLAGITSRTRARSEGLASMFGIPIVCDSIADLFGQTGADVILITVKEMGTRDAVAEAAAFDWIIFVEKPAGYRMDMAREIRDVLRRNGRRAFVGLNRRHYDATLKARSLLSRTSGPRHILVLDQQDMAAARRIGHPEDVVRHFMYANSIHTIDYLRMFGRGTIDRVVRDREWDGEATFVHGATVYFSSGDIGRYEAIWQGSGPWACFVTTPEVRVEMRPLERLLVQQAGERTPVPADLDSVDAVYKPGLYRQGEALVQAVRRGTSTLADINDSFEVMELINAIYGV